VTAALPGSRFANMSRDNEVEVRMLAVDEAVRRQGVGDRLMEACETFARDNGYRAVALSTEPDMYGAHRLYERRGYVRAPDRDWAIHGSTLLVYRLALQP
jgi:ribosomal protein S18 acetylase RimI-like enzyme